MKQKVGVFILNYKGINEIKGGSIHSINKAVNYLAVHGDVDVNIVFLDNFSNDGSEYIVRKVFPDSIIASTFQNEGYVRGTNIGIQLTYKLFSPDYFILVDSDNFCNEDTYFKLVEYMRRHPNAAMVQPMIKSKKDPSAIVSCGHTFKDNGGTRSIRNVDKSIDYDHLESCSISSTIVSAKALKKVGLLNEAYEMYYESTDLSFRFRKNGYNCACYCDAIAYNERVTGKEFKSFRKYYLMQRNLFLLWFLHDKSKYLYYSEYWKLRLEELQSRYDNADYIYDFSMEAERRGIIDGLKLYEEQSNNFLLVPMIDEFRKEDVLIFP